MSRAALGRGAWAATEGGPLLTSGLHEAWTVPSVVLCPVRITASAVCRRSHGAAHAGHANRHAHVPYTVQTLLCLSSSLTLKAASPWGQFLQDPVAFSQVGHRLRLGSPITWVPEKAEHSMKGEPSAQHAISKGMAP